MEEQRDNIYQNILNWDQEKIQKVERFTSNCVVSPLHMAIICNCPYAIIQHIADRSVFKEILPTVNNCLQAIKIKEALYIANLLNKNQIQYPLQYRHQATAESCISFNEMYHIAGAVA